MIVWGRDDFVYFRAGDSASFWKRGSFRSGSNIGSVCFPRARKAGFEEPTLAAFFWCVGWDFQAQLGQTLITLITAPFFRRVFEKQDRCAKDPTTDRA
jgi:hypothetical protein